MSLPFLAFPPGPLRQFWQSEVDFENARLLVERMGTDLDRQRLRRRAREAGVTDSLRLLLDATEPR